jgi:hypothetical protein
MSPIRQAQEKGAAKGVTLKGIVSSKDDTGFLLVDDGSFIKVNVSSSSSGGGDRRHSPYRTDDLSYKEGDYVEVQGDVTVVNYVSCFEAGATVSSISDTTTKPILHAPVHLSYAEIKAIADYYTSQLDEAASFRYVPYPWGYELDPLLSDLGSVYCSLLSPVSIGCRSESNSLRRIR